MVRPRGSSKPGLGTLLVGSGVLQSRHLARKAAAPRSAHVHVGSKAALDAHRGAFTDGAAGARAHLTVDKE